MGAVTATFNLYLMCCFLLVSDLRELEKVPLFLTATIDFLATGPGFCGHFFAYEFVRLDKFGVIPVTYGNWFVEMYELLRKYLSNHIRSFITQNFNWFVYACLPELFLQRLNEYGSGICSLLLAFDRYVNICRPTDAKVILARDKRQKWYFISTIVIICSFVCDAVIRYATHDWNCHWGFILTYQNNYLLRGGPNLFTISLNGMKS